MLKRISSVLRYLSWAEPPWKWKLRQGLCPCCGSTRFIEFREGPFLTRCLGCRNNLTNLSIIPQIIEHFHGSYENRRAYELSSYGATFEFMRAHFTDFEFSEFMPGMQSGRTVNGIRNENVQELSFPDEAFDLVTSNQVLEHVPDDLQAFKECCRVLKNGGAFISTVPLYEAAGTVQLARLRPDGGIEWLGTPEYHDSRMGGPKSAPVFWRHSSHDLADRVRTAGFRSAALVNVRICERQNQPQKVLYAIK